MEQPKSASERLDMLQLYDDARYPIIYVTTPEEERVIAAIQSIANRSNRPVYLWSHGLGLRVRNKPIEGTESPINALKKCIANPQEEAVYVFKDLDLFMQNPQVISLLREIADLFKTSYKSMFIISPVLQLPIHLQKEVLVVDLPLPKASEMSIFIDKVIDQIKQKAADASDKQPQRNEQTPIVDLPNGKEPLVRASLGLTLTETEDAISLSIAKYGCLDSRAIDCVLEEKRGIIRKSDIMEAFATDESLSQVGGLKNLKDWLTKRGLAFTEAAREFGIQPQKGVLILGIPGTGKSLAAKAIANEWKMPLLRLDMGRVMGSLIGQSEGNMRNALKVAEATAPSILWLDEIEKLMSGTKSSGASDGGTTARVFATFLTWANEKKSDVFIVATANDISQLPPELLRKGRFNEIFFVDLPTHEERIEIFNIHLQKVKRNPKHFNVNKLALQADTLTGAEIEQVIQDALFAALEAGRDINDKDITMAMKATVPLAKTMEEDITRLRKWAKDRAVLASPAEAEKLDTEVPGGGARIGNIRREPKQRPEDQNSTWQ